MKSLALELGLMFIIALTSVSLVEFAAPRPDSPPIPQPVPDVQATVERKAQPHQTHPEMLLVAFTLYPDQPPTIDAVKRLAEGRLSTPPPGDNHLKLIGPNGRVLYSLSFAADFILLDGPAEPLDRMTYTYVIPYTPEVSRVILTTAQGEAIEAIGPEPESEH